MNIQFFAKTVDLSERLSDDKPQIIIKGEVFEVNDGFKTILKVDNLLKDTSYSQLDMLTKFFEFVFGVEKANSLLDKGYSISAYKIIMDTVLNLIRGDDVGETQANAGTISTMTGI